MDKSPFDFVHYPFDVAYDFVIGEANDAVAVLRQPLISAVIIGLAHVVRVSIEFYYQLRFAAKKVGEIGADRHLSTEFPAADFSTRQAAP